MDEQIDFTEDDFNWNHELNMPQRVVDNMRSRRKRDSRRQD
jgi:hypothetical protein